MEWVDSILSALFVLIGVLMTFFILLQEGKGGGLTALGGTKAAGVEGVTNPIRRATAYLAAIFFVLAIILGIMHKPRTSLSRGAFGNPAAGAVAPAEKPVAGETKPAEAPKASEAPKTEATKPAEAPKTETKPAEAAKPADAPKTETPAKEEPKADAKPEAAKTDEPKKEEPKKEEPKKEEPAKTEEKK